MKMNFLVKNKKNNAFLLVVLCMLILGGFTNKHMSDDNYMKINKQSIITSNIATHTPSKQNTQNIVNTIPNSPVGISNDSSNQTQIAPTQNTQSIVDNNTSVSPEITKDSNSNQPQVVPVQKNNIDENTINTQQQIQPDKSLFVKYSSNNDNIITINDCISKLPINIINIFRDLNYNVILTNNPSYPQSGDYYGIFSYHDKFIEIIDKSEGVANEVVYHEFGHFLSYVMNNSNNTPEFIQIFNSEGLNAPNDYAKKSTAEYYASMFAFYILDSQYLKDNFPKTYQYIDYDVTQLGQMYSTILDFNKNHD